MVEQQEQIWHALNGKQARSTQGRGSFLSPEHHFSFKCIRGLKKQLYFLPTTLLLHRQKDTHTPVHTHALPAHGQTGRTRQGGTGALHPWRSGFSTGGGGQRPGQEVGPLRPQGTATPRATRTPCGTGQRHQQRDWKWKPGRLRNRVLRPPPHTQSHKNKGKNTAPHKQSKFQKESPSCTALSSMSKSGQTHFLVAFSSD